MKKSAFLTRKQGTPPILVCRNHFRGEFFTLVTILGDSLGISCRFQLPKIRVFSGKYQIFPRETSFRPPLGTMRPSKPLETTQEPTPRGICVVLGCLEAFSAFWKWYFWTVTNRPKSVTRALHFFGGFFQEKMPSNSNGSTFPRVSAIFSDFFSDPPLDFWPGTPILVEFLAQNPKNRVCDSPKQRFKQPCKGLPPPPPSPHTSSLV